MTKGGLKATAAYIRISVAEAIRQGIRKLKEMELFENYQMLVQNSLRGLWKKGRWIEFIKRKFRAEWNSR